jgi:class 3 adenylate cyclase
VLIEEGRLDAAEPLLAELGAIDVFSRGAVMMRMVEPVAAGIHLLRGEFERAEALDTQLMAIATARGVAQQEQVAGIVQGHGITLMRERGQFENGLVLLEALRQSPPPAVLAPPLDPVIALGYAETGRRDDALRLIDEILGRDLHGMSRSWGGIGMGLLCLLVEACALTDHVRGAAVLAPVVEPVGDCNVVLGMPPMVLNGWGSLYSGLCALLAGDLTRAGELVTEALAHNTAMQAWPAAARCRYHLARISIAREDGQLAIAHVTEALALAERLGLPTYADLSRTLLASLGGGPVAEHRGVLTFVFTDIEGSTARTVMAGDVGWASQLEGHASRVRALAAKHGGSVVKGLGDGFMLVFPSPLAAVGCAAAIQSGDDVPIRIGIHAGEAEHVDGDYIGHHVNLAARVAGAASAGETLVSELIRTLVEPKGITFGPPRSATLKGIPGAQTLYPVA